MGNFTEGFKMGATFFGLISFLALIPTFIWYIILTLIAWALNQSGLTGEWLHYWKHWWCLCVFTITFIGQSLVVIGGSK